MSDLKAGDYIRVNLPNMRDYTGRIVAMASPIVAKVQIRRPRGAWVTRLIPVSKLQRL